jgi:hypothetical protein
MHHDQPNIEFRVMPSGEGHWYWELLDGHTVLMRGVADNEPAACQAASDAARKAGLLKDDPKQ